MKKSFIQALLIIAAFILVIAAGCRDRVASAPGVEPTDTPTATATVTLTPTAGLTPMAPVLVDDFPSASIGSNLISGAWFAYSAAVDHWGYTGAAPGYDATGYALHLTGTVAAGCTGYGVWLVTVFNANADPVNASGLTGIKFYAKDPAGASYRFVLLSDTTGNNYQYTFTAPATWSQITIPFSTLTQATPDAVTIATVKAAAKRMAWVSGTCPETEDLWIDQIELY